MRSVVRTPDKDQRGSWATHAALRLHSNSSITDVTLERSNLEREGECQAEGDKQIDRVLVSAGHPPNPPMRRGFGLDESTAIDDVSGGSLASLTCNKTSATPLRRSHTSSHGNNCIVVLWCCTLTPPPPMNERPGQQFKMTNHMNRKLHGIQVLFRIHTHTKKQHSAVKHKGIQ